MNSMEQIWRTRFAHYVGEVQKYMQFIVTGHIAIVFVFVIGALGYQYSEWLKVAPNDFPAELLVAAVVGSIVAFSRPTTLLKEPDQVYLLPLETKMSGYFKKALTWTFWSQLLLPTISYIIAIPLLKAVTVLSTAEIWLTLLTIVVLKYVNVLVEFSFRYANRGEGILVDRVVRIALSIIAVEMTLKVGIHLGAMVLIVLVVYYMSLQQKVKSQPVPYEHLVAIEQSRMMSFYRFANYFTDVPHLRGAIRHRNVLDSFYRSIPHAQTSTQQYLVTRTFIRTNDHFYLWLRLTAIAAFFALFVELYIVTWIVAGALAFATVLQLRIALLSEGSFRMDMLYPVSPLQRQHAVYKLIRKLAVIQAIIVTLCAIGQPYFYMIPIIMIAISILTLRVGKK